MAVNAGDPGIRLKKEPVAGATVLGRVRWTICAMLFVATTINYMDRQVIAILKPTLAPQHRHDGSGLTVTSWPRFKLPMRSACWLPGGLWTRSARASATWSSWLSGAFRRWATRWPTPCWSSALRVSPWDSANRATSPRPSRPWPSGFRRASARWPQASSTPAPMSAPSWLRSSCPGHAPLWLARGLSGHRRLQRDRGSCLWFSNYRKPAEHPTLTGAELRHIYQEAPRSMGPPRRGSNCSGYRQTWAFSIAKFLTDPIWWFYLFWLPSLLQRKDSIWIFRIWDCRSSSSTTPRPSAASAEAGCPPPSAAWGLSATKRAAGGHALLRLPGGSRLYDQLSPFGVGCHRAAQPGHGRAPGLVGQSFHHCLGYVSAQRGRLGDRHRRHGRLGRRLPVGYLSPVTSCN